MKKAVFLLLCVIFCLSVCTGGASALWSSSGWEKAYYLDPFGDATEDYYLGMTQRASGSYKSSSVTDGALEAELRVDANRICILLFENGRDQVRNGEHSAIAYTVLMKAADGSKTQLYGRMASGGDCVEIWENQAGSILHFAGAAPEETPVAKALCAGDGEVSFYLTREDQPATSYLFTVKTGDFAALYEAEIVTPIQEAAYARAEQCLAENAFDDAESLFRALGDYRDSAVRVNEAREKQEGPRGLRIEMGKSIAAGDFHTVGLKADGTVVAVGYNEDGQCEVSGWSDIVAVAAGYAHTVGLKADGTVVAVGSNRDFRGNYVGQCEVSGWLGIVAVAAGDYHTVGLKVDGTVVAVGDNYFGQCEVSGWSDIVAVAASAYHTVGLKADGTVVAVGYNASGQCEVSGWSDIVAVAAGNWHTAGLKADGTVVTVGSNRDFRGNYVGQCEVSGWSDIVAVAAGDNHTVGLKADGTVVAVGSNEEGQCDVSDWTDIRLP